MAASKKVRKIRSTGMLLCYGSVPEECLNQMEAFLDRTPDTKCVQREVWAVTNPQRSHEAFAGKMHWKREVSLS